MGWRAQQAFDEADRRAEREWLASLPWKQRLYVPFWQTIRLAIFFAILALVIYMTFRHFQDATLIELGTR